MDTNVLDILTERGFVGQLTHEDEIRELLGKEKVTFYIGFDPTADSLHVGHFLQVMVMAHMQQAGHRPIALMGGGTGMVGDPTDRTDMRKVMTVCDIQHNVNCFKQQMSKFIDFNDGKAILLDNADWLMKLQYVPFLREIGVHFSVNRMLTADSYRTRFEKGLSFFEFNYQLMQAYDFLELNRKHNCTMQFGGNDQWSNIIAGIELIRKVENKESYGVTFNLLTNSAGNKMGKTASGAIWLDANKTTPYEFYQYWRNVDDDIVGKLLRLLTFLPMEEIRELDKLKDKEINRAKEILAYEVTKNVHSKEDAENARDAAKALFSGGTMSGSVPETVMAESDFNGGLSIIDLMEKTGLAPTRSEARRLISGGGIKLNDNKVETHELMVTKDDFKDNELMLQKGKKTYHRVRLG
ncbi:MAG: tyrosine--tRNA ligase [Clostridiales bacterium]|nr:tyrosine--tRNA ligase [Clostridiales bacterium]